MTYRRGFRTSLLHRSSPTPQLPPFESPGEFPANKPTSIISHQLVSSPKLAHRLGRRTQDFRRGVLESTGAAGLECLGSVFDSQLPRMPATACKSRTCTCKREERRTGPVLGRSRVAGSCGIGRQAAGKEGGCSATTESGGLGQGGRSCARQGGIGI